jgi:hypothetical protein
MLVGVAIFALVAVWAYSAFLDSNRFIVTNAGGGAVYKTDKRTGKTTVLRGAKEFAVQPPEDAVMAFLNAPSPEETAIKLAQDATTLHKYKINRYFLAEWLKEQKGDIRVGGWSAKKVDDQTYLVTYALVRDGKGEGVRFEVNLAAQLVRNVKGDPALEEKYSVN